MIRGNTCAFRPCGKSACLGEAFCATCYGEGRPVETFFYRTLDEHLPFSNFYPSPFDIDEWHFPTVEHYFQAMKAAKHEGSVYVCEASTPGEAKKRGRKIVLRSDWETVKLGIMLQALRVKFRDEHFATYLLSTGDSLLIEGNNWNDTFWGKVDGDGENWLGFLLMTVRAELRAA